MQLTALGATYRQDFCKYLVEESFASVIGFRIGNLKENAKDAIEIIDNQRADVLFQDIHLPDGPVTTIIRKRNHEI